MAIGEWETVEHDGPRLIERHTGSLLYTGRCRDCLDQREDVSLSDAQDFIDHHHCEDKS
jgi:hypothetical protein